MKNRDEMLNFLLMEGVYSDENRQVLGENISPYSEVKIIFEQYGLNEDDNKVDHNKQCYSIFVHKNSGNSNFNFPSHKSSFGLIVHRPDQEVYFRGWYDSFDQELSLNDTDESIEETEISKEEIDKVITTLYLKYR